MKNDMTAAKAVTILTAAIGAVEYLEKMAQASVNHNGKAIAESVKRDEDVNGADMFVAWREKKKVSKTVTAVKSTLSFGAAVEKYEAKLASIETTAAPKAKELGLVK